TSIRSSTVTEDSSQPTGRSRNDFTLNQNLVAQIQFLMRNIFPLVALLTLPLAAAEQGKPGEAARLDKVEIQGEAKPGGNVVAVVHVKLEKNWHVQSNKPSEPSYIPTVLNLSPTPGVKPGTIKYPEGKSEKVQGLEKPRSVYDGDFQISALLNLDAKAKLPLTIPATVKYRACHGATCYPPKSSKSDCVIGAAGNRNKRGSWVGQRW